MSASKTRRRRSAEEAHAAILEVAQRQLIAHGPDSIRLQDVAAAVGVSHPTVLHHFGSREGLMLAAVEHVRDTIYAQVFAALADVDFSVTSLGSVLERIAQVIGAGGNARVLYWLALSGMGDLENGPLTRVVEVIHALRTQRSRERGERVPSREDTRSVVMLVTYALASDSVLGVQLFASEPDAGKRFRGWLAELVASYVQREPPPPAKKSSVKRRVSKTR